MFHRFTSSGQFYIPYSRSSPLQFTVHSLVHRSTNLQFSPVFGPQFCPPVNSLQFSPLVNQSQFDFTVLSTPIPVYFFLSCMLKRSPVHWSTSPHSVVTVHQLKIHSSAHSPQSTVLPTSPHGAIHEKITDQRFT